MVFVGDKDNEKEWATEIDIPIKDVSIPGEPAIKEGLTPIKWNGTTEVATTIDDKKWYDYDNKLWVNAKSTDGSYWVWIPRYAYRIIYYASEADKNAAEALPVDNSGRETKAIGYSDVRGIVDKNGVANNTFDRRFGIIEIEFLGKASNKYKYKENGEYRYNVTKTKGTDNPRGLVVHPAFSPVRRQGYTKSTDGNFGWDSEITGFWTAKFVMSSNGDTCKSEPNIYPEVGLSLSEIYKKSRNLADEIGLSGKYISMNQTNTQWGAVLYISVAKGIAPDDELNDSVYTGDGDYKANVNFSTTHNITGVYDMSGGRYEKVSAYLANGTANLANYSQELVNNKDTRYVEVYSVASEDDLRKNYQKNSDKYGDAKFEISTDTTIPFTSWKGENAFYPLLSEPTFYVGGMIVDGVFSFKGGKGGDEFKGHSYRIVLVPPDSDAM